MNGIYFFEGIDFKDNSNLGIENKIKQQIKCLKSFGTLIVIKTTFKKSLLEKIKFIVPLVKSDREKQRESLLKNVSDKTDYIYIRKPSLTINFHKILRKIKNQYPNIFIIMEIPTYPFHSEYTGLSKIMALKSIRCEKKLRRTVDRIATYSDDNKIWDIETIRLSNCVDYSKIPPRSKNYHTVSKTIRLTCVANFTYWHGLDRLINGIKNYRGDYKIILNLVGGGREINNLKQLANGAPNIVFQGPKSGKALSEIFDNTDIAVDALGRHRSRVYYNSSLKGKEYAARGTPIISAVKTELDYLDNFPYYLKLPANDTPIDIENIIKFHEHIYSSKNENEITKSIREKTQKLFDYQTGYKNIIYNALLENAEKLGDK